MHRKRGKDLYRKKRREKGYRMRHGQYLFYANGRRPGKSTIAYSLWAANAEEIGSSTITVEKILAAAELVAASGIKSGAALDLWRREVWNQHFEAASASPFWKSLRGF